MKYAILFALLLVAGCASVQTQQQAVLAAETGYIAAETAATQYASLPRCPTGAPLCSTQSAVDAIVRARDVARAALLNADKVVNDPNVTSSAAKEAAASATAALSSLQTALTTYGVK